MSVCSRLAGALTAAILLVGVPWVPGHAEPGAGAGRLELTVTDHLGQPARAGVSLVSDSGNAQGSFTTGVGPSAVFDLEPARYAVVYLAPWAGIGCVGIVPCDVYPGPDAEPAVIVGVVEVIEGQTATYVLRTPRPATVHGAPGVGSTLSVDLTDEMDLLTSFYGEATAVSVQWLRNGTPIPGARRTSYTTTALDVGRTVAPRLAYHASMVQHFADMGLEARPITLPGRSVTRTATRTTARLFPRVVPVGRDARLRVDVTAGRLPATGRVRIEVGRRTLTRTLRNGWVRAVLPRQRPGRYRVVASYLGDDLSATSRSAARTLTVTKR